MFVRVRGRPRVVDGTAIYGLIIVSVLLAAESARRETYAKTVAAVGVVILLLRLALH